MANGITFYSGEQKADANALYAVIEKRIFNKNELFVELYEILQFPGYFGFNWDALSDCLRDFHWIDLRQIILVHKVFPELPANDLKTYLEILYDATESWACDEEHSLAVRFNQNEQALISSLLHSHKFCSQVTE